MSANEMNITTGLNVLPIIVPGPGATTKVGAASLIDHRAIAGAGKQLVTWQPRKGAFVANPCGDTFRVNP